MFVGGCSYFNDTRLHKVLGKDTDLISFSYKIADSLIERAMPPLMPGHPDMPIMVTTFVDNNDLKKTSRFGRLLQEHISSRMVQIGYTVREIKLTRTITMEAKSGETVLSRDLTKISGEIQAQAVVAGTISRSGRMLYLSARLIAPENSNILATCDHQLFMDDNLLAMYGLRLNDDIDTPITEPIQPPLNAIFW
ncbi:MAG: FlgO family outer membrane protein [Desulforhopalus sp.]|nr:FlgO family outer membrane protein [Desulforhopalus sp.]